MTGFLTILNAGSTSSLQDMGRQGHLAYGLTRGGAADKRALFEAAALLNHSPDVAAIEMGGMGGTYQSDRNIVVALTGAPMRAEIDSTPVAWSASHLLPAGASLKIGGTMQGVYGYLSVKGGFEVPQVMGARSAHLQAGIGDLLQAGQSLPLETSSLTRAGYCITNDARFSGGDVRIVPSVQTDQFTDNTLHRFTDTTFHRDPRGNRQGVRMASDSDGFFVEGGLSIVSEVITEGDIQITGDGAPYVLMCECQTTGGYPRIGTVIPSDMPRIAQTPVGASLRFCFITFEEAQILEQKDRAALNALPGQAQPLVRDPSDMSDLLNYQLVSGAISATADPFTY